MNQRLRYLGILLVAYAIWFVSFMAVGRFAATLPTRDLTSALDRAIPLMPSFVWPYELCYALPVLALFVLRDFRRFDRALLAIGLASASAYVVYLAFPIAFPRPVLGDTLAERILALEYAADFHPGANKLPSMHVALSWIMGFAMRRQRGRVLDGTLIVTVLAITASTVLVKQHLLIDVAAGIGWAFGAWWVAGVVTTRETRRRLAVAAAPVAPAEPELHAIDADRFTERA
jgi:membrane-associated phospholipid phosphatase